MKQNHPHPQRPAAARKIEAARTHALRAFANYIKLLPPAREPKTPPKIGLRMMGAYPSSFGLGCNMILGPFVMPGQIPVLVVPLDPASLAAVRTRVNAAILRLNPMDGHATSQQIMEAALRAISPHLSK